MRLEADARDNVVLLGVLERGIFRAKASGFFVHVPTRFGPVNYLITTEQTILKLFGKGHQTILARLTSAGGEMIEVPIEQWFFHPGSDARISDVAVVQLPGATAGSNARGPSVSVLVADSAKAERACWEGAEVAVIGLFRNHYGRGTNIPVVRTGNIAARPDHPLRTARGEMNAYLIELNSFAGLTGSPVYVDLPSNDRGYSSEPTSKQCRGTGLLGLMSEPFPLPNAMEDSVVDHPEANSGREEPDAINTGICVVVPAQKIIETINRAEFHIAREKAISAIEQMKGIGFRPIAEFILATTNTELCEQQLDSSP